MLPLAQALYKVIGMRVIGVICTGIPPVKAAYTIEPAIEEKPPNTRGNNRRKRPRHQQLPVMRPHTERK